MIVQKDTCTCTKRDLLRSASVCNTQSQYKYLGVVELNQFWNTHTRVRWLIVLAVDCGAGIAERKDSV